MMKTREAKGLSKDQAHIQVYFLRKYSYKFEKRIVLNWESNCLLIRNQDIWPLDPVESLTRI